MASHKKVGSWPGFWDLFTKLHRSSWMSDVFAISSEKMWLASQVGPARALKNEECNSKGQSSVRKV